MQSGVRHDLLGRIVGLLVFLVGVALLGLVFAKAFALFGAPPAEALGLKFTGDPKRDPTAALIGSQFGWLLFRIAYLFIMAIAGSLMSQKGINLYFSSMKGHVVNIGHHERETPGSTRPS